MQSLINDKSHHFNEQTPHYPSCQRLKITRISLSDKARSTQRSYFLGNTEHHTNKPIESTRECTKITTGMHKLNRKFPCGKFHIFFCLPERYLISANIIAVQGLLIALLTI